MAYSHSMVPGRLLVTSRRAVFYALIADTEVLGRQAEAGRGAHRGVPRCSARRHVVRRHHPFIPERVQIFDDRLVANIGVPRTAELVLRHGQRGRTVSHRIPVPEGSREADIVRALHLASTNLGGSTVEGGQPLPICDPVLPSFRRVPPSPPVKPAPKPNPRRPAKLQPRLVRDFREAEHLAADWARWMRFAKVQVTAPTNDAGLDITGTGMAGQVKCEANKTGRPVLQALYGAGHANGARHWLFFSSAGYTPAAVTWANQVEIGLIRFTLDGVIEPINAAAKRYYRDGAPKTR